MYIRFEDWTFPYTLNVLNQKKIPHGNKIIKVFATEEDPRVLFEKPTLTVLEVDDSPLTDEQYDFGERGIYSGKDFEQYLTGKKLTEKAKRVARALIRFGTPFAQKAMEARTEEGYLINHPLDGIDGFQYGTEQFVGSELERILHLDIFFPESLAKLREIVDYEDLGKVRNFREVIDYRKREYETGGSKERE